MDITALMVTVPLTDSLNSERLTFAVISSFLRVSNTALGPLTRTVRDFVSTSHFSLSAPVRVISLMEKALTIVPTCDIVTLTDSTFSVEITPSGKLSL